MVYIHTTKTLNYMLDCLHINNHIRILPYIFFAKHCLSKMFGFVFITFYFNFLRVSRLLQISEPLINNIIFCECAPIKLFI